MSEFITDRKRELAAASLAVITALGISACSGTKTTEPSNESTQRPLAFGDTLGGIVSEECGIADHYKLAEGSIILYKYNDNLKSIHDIPSTGYIDVPADLCELLEH